MSTIALMSIVDEVADLARSATEAVLIRKDPAEARTYEERIKQLRNDIQGGTTWNPAS